MKTVFSLVAILMFMISSCGQKSDNNINNLNNDLEEKNVAIDTVQQYSIQSGKYIPADSYYTGKDSLYITLIGHASIMFEYKGSIIHVDPYSKVADYSKLPKANLILLTHEHGDHLDSLAISEVATADTKFIMTKACREILGFGEVVGNNEIAAFYPANILAVPAYNIVHKRPDGEFYHPKDRGNGYLLNFDGLTVYVAGDTENIPEMESLKDRNIDIAFLPKNLPYTMSDDMFIDAAKKVMPKYLYPYHMSEFNKSKIGDALSDTRISLIVKPMSNL